MTALKKRSVSLAGHATSAHSWFTSASGTSQPGSTAGSPAGRAAPNSAETAAETTAPRSSQERTSRYRVRHRGRNFAQNWQSGRSGIQTSKTCVTGRARRANGPRASKT